jgi:anti-sigma regulatory factor (Ser/Thr protein kinase)
MTLGEPLDAADGWLLCTALAAAPDSVSQARGLVRDLLASLDAAPGLVADVALAVSEAAANAVLHAYEGDGGTFDLCARRDELGRLRVIVRDYGLGFRRGRRGGAGFGLMLMRRLADECHVEPADPGVAVRLAFVMSAAR